MSTNKAQVFHSALSRIPERDRNRSLSGDYRLRSAQAPRRQEEGEIMDGVLRFSCDLITVESAEPQQFREINGKTFRVTGKVERPCGQIVPVVDIPWMSDIKWQRDGYEDRLRRPDVYSDNLGENVPQVLARLRAWLLEHDPDAEQWLASVERAAQGGGQDA